MITYCVVIIWFYFALLAALSLAKNSLKNLFLYRCIYAILGVPTILAAILLLKYSLLGHNFTDIIITYYNININFGLNLTWINATLIICSILSMQIFLFMSPNFVAISNLTLIIITTFFYIIIILPKDLFMVTCVFSLSSIIITFLRIYFHGDNISIKDIARDFLWMRLVDILAMSGLLIRYYEDGNIILNNNFYAYNYKYACASILIFSAIVIRIISIKPTRADNITASSVFHLGHMQHRYFTGISTLLWMIKVSEILFYEYTIIYFQIASLLLVIMAVISLINIRNKTNYDSVFIFSLMSFGLLCISLNLSPYFNLLTGGLILLFPIYILSKIYFLQSRPPVFNSSVKERDGGIDLVLAVNIFSKKIAIFISRIFSNFINPFYSSFLLFKLPQLIMFSIQVPIRFFHNGSIQRSMLFIVIMLSSYYYIWG